MRRTGYEEIIDRDCHVHGMFSEGSQKMKMCLKLAYYAFLSSSL